MNWCNQIFLALWSVQNKIDQARALAGSTYEWFKACVFDGFASHVVYANSAGKVVPITVYNYDNVRSLVKFAYLKYSGLCSKLPLMPANRRPLVDGATEDDFDMMIFKYYRDGKRYFEVVKIPEVTGTTTREYIGSGDAEQEKASFHHLHSPYMIAFITSTESETMKEVSKEFAEVGILLAKAGMQVGALMQIMSEFYAFDYEELVKQIPNYRLNIMLPKQSLCVYKENDKIVV
jgi:hypothetical protein